MMKAKVKVFGLKVKQKQKQLNCIFVICDYVQTKYCSHFCGRDVYFFRHAKCCW
ncbi:MAG: hypothetical protein ACI9OD_003570 [Limisphaerales bacterium]